MSHPLLPPDGFPSACGRPVLLPIEQDLGLDVIRVWALISMIIAHAADPLDPGTAAGLVKYFADAAPIWFFFAFGMTMPRLLLKPLQQQLAISSSFFLVALAHNIYSGSLLVWEFLFSLWSAQAAMIAIEAWGRRPLWWYVTALLVCAIETLPCVSELQARWFMLPGPFLPAPWWGIALAGVLYVRGGERRHAGGIGIGLVAAGAGLGYWGQVSGWSGFEITRWPLHMSYALLFCGLVIAVQGSMRAMRARLKAVPTLLRHIRFLSHYLLLGTAVHFIPVGVVRHLSSLLGARLAEDAIWSGPAGDWARVVIGGMAAVWAVFWSLPRVVRLWEWTGTIPWLAWVRAYSSLVGATGLVVAWWLQAPGAGPWPPELGRTAGKVAALVLLIYLALSHSHRPGRRNGS